MLETLKNILTSMSDFFQGFYELILNVVSFLTSILGMVFYGGKTLIIGVFKLLYSVFDGGVFVNVNRAFVSLSQYIGGPATVFFGALLFIIIVRIIVAFVFKILRMNTDYEVRKTNWSKGREQTWEKHISDSLDEFENGKRIFR